MFDFRYALSLHIHIFFKYVHSLKLLVSVYIIPLQSHKLYADSAALIFRAL